MSIANEVIVVEFSLTEEQAESIKRQDFQHNMGTSSGSYTVTSYLVRGGRKFRVIVPALGSSESVQALYQDESDLGEPRWTILGNNGVEVGPITMWSRSVIALAMRRLCGIGNTELGTTTKTGARHVILT
jgi:hypothetical protein